MLKKLKLAIDDAERAELAGDAAWAAPSDAAWTAAYAAAAEDVKATREKVRKILEKMLEKYI